VSAKQTRNKHMNNLSAKEVKSLMRQHRKTIRGLAQQWNLTLKRVRHVRTNGVSGEAFVRDWLEILSAPQPIQSVQRTL
jgi:hypothetical protein